MSEDKLELTSNPAIFHMPYSPKPSMVSMSMDPTFLRDQNEDKKPLTSVRQFVAGDHYFYGHN